MQKLFKSRIQKRTQMGILRCELHLRIKSAKCIMQFYHFYMLKLRLKWLSKIKKFLPKEEWKLYIESRIYINLNQIFSKINGKVGCLLTHYRNDTPQVPNLWAEAAEVSLSIRVEVARYPPFLSLDTNMTQQFVESTVEVIVYVWRLAIQNSRTNFFAT